jgi:hypothetical protein
MPSKPIEGQYIAKEEVVIDDPSTGVFVYIRKPGTAKADQPKELNDDLWFWLLILAVIGMWVFFISCLPR